MDKVVDARNTGLKVLVSIVNWNNNSATNECLAGIARIPREDQPDVCVVDNHSTEDKFEIKKDIKAGLRGLRVVVNPKNLGFSGGHNVNIRYAHKNSYDYVVLLNNDSEIVDTGIFSKLTNELEHRPNALAANPAILSSMNPGTIWYGGGKLSLRSSSVSHLRVGLGPADLPKSPQKVSFLTGGCLAINLKRAGLDQLVLPEEYFVYWEDTEWCARALQAGFELIFVPQARLLHHVSSSLGVRSPLYIYYNIRNHILFIKRNTKAIFRPVCYLRVIWIMIKYKLNIISRYRNHRLKALKALWRGAWDGMNNRGGEAQVDL